MDITEIPLLLDDPLMVGMYLAIFVSVAAIPVCWIFQWLKKEYRIDTHRALMLWVEEVEADAFWIWPITIGSILWLTLSWVWMPLCIALLIFVGMAKVSGRLRTESSRTSNGLKVFAEILPPE